MWEECVATHRAQFPGAEIEVFCHFWDTIQDEERQRLRSALRPTLCHFENPPDYSVVDTYDWLRRDLINVPSRMVSQYASWQRVGTMFIPYAPLFDVVVRMRTDLYFYQPLQADLEGIAEKRIGFIGYEWTESKDVVFDAFALGTPNFMIHFHMLLSGLWDYTANSLFNPELLVTRHIEAYHKKATVQMQGRLPFFIRRPHMAGWPVDRCLAEGPGVAKWRDPEIHNAHLDYHQKISGHAGIDYVNRFRARQLRLPESEG
jgi:hypothetical protein